MFPSLKKTAFQILFCSIAIYSTSVLSQSRSFDCTKKLTTVQSNLALDSLQSRYSNVQTLTASFSQLSKNAALDMTETSSGSVQFKKPGMMRWDYSEPEKQVLTLNKNEVRFYQESENQGFIDNVSQVLLSDLPVSFLAGIGNIKDSFNLISGCNGSDGTILTLSPKQKTTGQNSGKIEEAKIKELKIIVEDSSFLPKGASVLDSSDNETAILLSKLFIGEEIKDSSFTFNFPRGADVVNKTNGLG